MDEVDFPKTQDVVANISERKTLHIREYQKGIDDYQIIQQHERFYDGKTGKSLLGLYLDNGKEYHPILARRGNQIVSDFNAEDYIQQVKKILNVLSKEKPVDRLKYYDRDIRNHMIGFGRTALAAVDIRTAVLAFEAVGVLDFPEITNNFNETIRKEFLKRNPKAVLINQVYRDTLREVYCDRKKLEENKNYLKERPKRKDLIPDPIIVEPQFYNDKISAKISHPGTADVYILKPDNKSILKIRGFSSEEIYKFDNEIECLKKAKGVGGLPILEALMKDRYYSSPRGIQMERIIGKSLADGLVIRRMTPESFGVSNRLWFVYDLVEAYKATGVVHGDLIDKRMDNKGKFMLGGNKGNMILEDGTNRLRMIDYGLHPDYKTSDISFAKREMEAVIEFLFMGRIEADSLMEPLPTNTDLSEIGQQILKRLEFVKSVDTMLDIIPPKYRLPGEKH